MTIWGSLWIACYETRADSRRWPYPPEKQLYNVSSSIWSGDLVEKLYNMLMLRGRDRFWVSQLVLWVLYAIASSLVRLTYTHHDYDGPDTVIIIINTILGFGVSSVMGYYYHSLSLSQAGRNLLIAVVASIACAFIWTICGNWIYSLIDPVRWQDAHFSIYLVGVLNASFILLCWSAGYFSFKYYKQSLDQRQVMSELKIQAQQAKLQMLRYQVNPHFLFNTLASISALIRDNENSAADEMLGRMSELLRLTLKSSPVDMVTLEEELRILDMYIQIEKVRFQDRLQYTCETDEASLPVLVPSLILQPLVENSVKHAIARAQQGGEIKLSVCVEEGRLIVSLSDSGQPVDQAVTETGQGSTKLGLKNVQRRLKNIYEDDHKFTFGESGTGGFKIEMNLPAYTPEHAAN
jgi:two-component system LytT family sensor kinase